jgi:hypothetical protein
MKYFKVFGLALVAMCALSAAAVSSASAALEFLASKAGTLKGHALTTQAFKAEAAGPAVNCTEAASSGAVSSPLNFLTVLIEVEYGKCTGPLSTAATVSLADFLFNAHGLVAVDNTITIKIGTLCKIVVAPTGNGALEKVKYDNNAGKLIELTSVTGITSKIEGGSGLCGSEGTHTDGTYTGNNEIELVSGTISID